MGERRNSPKRGGGELALPGQLAWSWSLGKAFGEPELWAAGRAGWRGCPRERLRRLSRRKRGGQPKRRKVAEQRKGHERLSHRTQNAQPPAPGSTWQGRRAVAVGLLQCGCSSLVPGRRECGRRAKRKGGRSRVPPSSPSLCRFALDSLLCLPSAWH